LADRLRSHKCDSHLCTSRQIINGGDFEIIHLEDYPCANRKEAGARERWWIENHACVNTQIPGRTHKEWYQDNKEAIVLYRKKWTEANKEALSARDKSYHEANKEAISARKKQSYEYNKLMQGLNRIQID